MADVENSAVTPLPIEQCLFGYDDGHRLLASSQRVGSEVALELTPLSDLASGALFGEDGGYWTGLPIPKMGKYALMRTWPAPEMKRPGCVWTHALLIDPGSFEDIYDLSQLRKLARRPTHPGEREAYSSSIEFRAAQGLPGVVRTPRPTLIRELFDVVYGGEGHEILCDSPSDLDDLVFDVWSQQWPKLRRNFRFQTALLRGSGSSSTRFDLQFRLGYRERDTRQVYSPASAWRDAAVGDLREKPRGELRAFLWRYGDDVVRQKGSFRPLCEVYTTASGLTSAELLEALPDSISRWFPDREDAKELKSDLVGGRAFPELQLDFAEFAEGTNQTSFPPVSRDAVAGLGSFWGTERSRLLDLATHMAEKANRDTNALVSLIAGKETPDEFWPDMRERPALTKLVLTERPELAPSPGVEMLKTSEIKDVLATVGGVPAVVAEMVSRLLQTASEQTALMFFDAYPDLAMRGVISALEEGERLSPWWLAAISARPGLLSSETVFAAVQRTSTLYRLADVLGWMSSGVQQAGFKPWWLAFERAINDLRQDQLDELSALVLALALRSSDPSNQAPFERLFETVHSSIVSSRLPWRAQQFLLPLLPDVGWLRGWDTGFRLRLATASAYVFSDLPPQSYASLSADPHTRQLLEQAASEVTGGKRYAKAARKG